MISHLWKCLLAAWISLPLACQTQGPVIQQVIPSSITANSGNTFIRILGINLLGNAQPNQPPAFCKPPAVAVTFLGTTIPITGTPTSTEVDATVPASLLTKPQPATVQVTTSNAVFVSPNYSCSTSSATATVQITPNTSAQIQQIIPNPIPAGSPTTTIRILGQNLAPSGQCVPRGIAVTWNGSALTLAGAATAAEVDAVVPASLLAKPGTATVAVAVTDCTSSSDSAQVQIVATGPVVGTVSPTQATACGPDFPLTVNGSGFQPGNALIGFGPDPSALNPILPDTQTGTQLIGTVSASWIQTPETAGVYAANQNADGSYTFSNGVDFTVNPAPVVQQVAPGSLPAGSASTQISTIVLNYVPGVTQIVWGTANGYLPVVSATQESGIATQVVLQVDATLIPATPTSIAVRAVNVEPANPKGTLYAATCAPPATLNIVNTAPTVQSVANLADGSGALAPGVLATVSGVNIGPTQSQSGAASGLSVTVNGKPAAVLLSSATQINVQIPVDLNPGPATVIVQYQGKTSSAFSIQLAAYAPALMTNTTGPKMVIFARADGTAGTAQNVPSPGEVITLYTDGLGSTNPAVATGAVATTFTPTAIKPLVTINGEPATVLDAALSSTAPGTYLVRVQIPGDLNSGTFPVIVSIGGFVSTPQPLPIAIVGIVLTQTGFTFTAVQGGGAPSPETFGILNTGSGNITFTLTPSTVSGGDIWLTVSPLGGTIAPGQSATITVTVDPTKVSPNTPRDYYAQIRVDAPGAVNTPQLLTVVLNLLPSTATQPPVLEPTGLVFLGLVKGNNPGSQSVRITSLSNRASAFAATVAVPGILGSQKPITVSPASGSVAPNQPATLAVSADITSISAGAYPGTITLQFPQDNVTRTVAILLVVAPAVSSSMPDLSAESIVPRAPCTPTKLLPTLTLLGADFSTATGWPANIQTVVVDDCANYVDAGTVNATFSNTDPPLSLQDSGEHLGRWSATWGAQHAAASALTVTVTAQANGLTGSTSVTGGAQANPNVPLVYPNGTVSSGSYASTATPSPGELVSIFGAQLADGTQSASALPLLTSMQNAIVTLAGVKLPLVFTSAGQINAQIPYVFPGKVTLPLVVQHGDRTSIPQPVTLVSAEPAIFTSNLLGTGQGLIFVVPNPTSQILADDSAPAKAGDVIIVYCTGLGAVNPPVTAGQATTSDTLHQAGGAVVLNIGGVTVTPAFAGLSPGFTGLYQINATMPAGVTPGSQVPVFITVGGAYQSPTVTMAAK
jgi:uncharacterized protein (TIGR03437 family)